MSRSCEASMRTGASPASMCRQRRQRPGVQAVYTAADLGAYLKPGPMLVPPPPIPNLVFHPCTQLPLAKDKVRHVGEPIAMIVADNRYVAEDAIRDVVVDIDPIDAVVDLEKGLAPDAPLIHEHLSSNLAAHVVQRKGDYASAKKSADVIVKRRFHYDRGVSARDRESRGRGGLERESRRDDDLGHDAGAHSDSKRAGAMLGLLESQVNVIAPFVGGGFGPKIMMFYPEEVLLPWAAMRLNRPLKWTEDRQENFYATTQERGQVHDAEMALTRDGRILGVHDVFLFDTGAYDPYGLTIPINSQCTLLGPVRHSQLRERVHGGLHQQDDRHAGARRRTAARRVRQRAAARSRRARARHRSRRDSQAQSACTGQIPGEPRDHVSGLRAARLRQRRLSADAGSGRRDDRIRDSSCARSSRSCARKDAMSASGWRATSKAPASARTRAHA